jgi:mannose-6-phosphate isomerase-like protein (cupin superfamily)
MIDKRTWTSYLVYMPTTALSVIPAETAPRFDLPGVRFIAGAAPSRGSEQLCVWTIVVAPGHTSAQAHVLDRDEVFTVVSGTIRLQDEAEPLVAGDTAVVPAGAPIQLANPGEHPARVHVAIQAGFRATMADGSDVGTPPWAQ